MRTAALPYFRKLWGRIDNGLPKGDYTVEITNRKHSQRILLPFYSSSTNAATFTNKNADFLSCRVSSGQLRWKEIFRSLHSERIWRQEFLPWNQLSCDGYYLLHHPSSLRL